MSSSTSFPLDYHPFIENMKKMFEEPLPDSIEAYLQYPSKDCVYAAFVYKQDVKSFVRKNVEFIFELVELEFPLEARKLIKESKNLLKESFGLSFIDGRNLCDEAKRLSNEAIRIRTLYEPDMDKKFPKIFDYFLAIFKCLNGLEMFDFMIEIFAEISFYHFLERVKNSLAVNFFFILLEKREQFPESFDKIFSEIFYSAIIRTLVKERTDHLDLLLTIPNVTVNFPSKTIRVIEIHDIRDLDKILQNIPQLIEIVKDFSIICDSNDQINLLFNYGFASKVNIDFIRSFEGIDNFIQAFPAQRFFESKFPNIKLDVASLFVKYKDLVFSDVMARELVEMIERKTLFRRYEIQATYFLINRTVLSLEEKNLLGTRVNLALPEGMKKFKPFLC